MSVTQKAVFTLPNGVHRVEDCLYLRVQDSGRSFIFRYMKDGKRRDIGVGSALKVSVAQAKAIASKYRTEIAAGRDPKPKKTKTEEKKARTFREVAADALENTKEVRQWKRERQAGRWWQILVSYGLQVLGDKPIRQIGRQDIIDVLTPIWFEKNPTASYLRTILERVFSYAIFNGEYTNANPAVYKGNLDIVLPSTAKIHKTKHYAATDLDQMKRVMIELIEEHSVISLTVAVIMLTALRQVEVTKAEWTEIDLNEKVFSVPPERRKVARDYPHRVPITKQLEEIFKFLGHEKVNEYVFWSRKRKGKPIKPGSTLVLLQRVAGEEATIHGCRSTFRVWAEETGQNTTAAEYQMMHENPSAVVRAYQRSDLLEQRRELMQRWADEVLPMDVLMKALGATPKPKVRNVPELEKIYGDKFKCF